MLLFARTSLDAGLLARQFAQGRIRKTYLAIVVGKPELHDLPQTTMSDGSRGALVTRHVALMADKRLGERMRIIGTPFGPPARLNATDPAHPRALEASMAISVVESSGIGGSALSLVRMEPYHGRRHMLRVLLADAVPESKGVLGDFKLAKGDPQHARLGFQNSGQICLHALDLTFVVRWRTLRLLADTTQDQLPNGYKIEQVKAPPTGRFLDAAYTAGLLKLHRSEFPYAKEVSTLAELRRSRGVRRVG